MKVPLILFVLLMMAARSFAAEEAVSVKGAQKEGIPEDQTRFFEQFIRPVLVKQCYECHSSEAKKIKGGLNLDSRQGLQLGGESGRPGVVPGSLKDGTLWEAISWTNDDMQMPPKNKLPDDVIANFKKWIEMGAPDPRESTVANAGGGKRIIDIDEGRKHWSFQKPVIKEPKAVQTSGWAKSQIDQYVLAEMEAKGLKPVRDADKATLIRRIAFDLTGLPPTPEEVKSFLADTSPDAVARVVDTYLESQRYGERWGRHWLDVARYAESSGKEVNMLYPHAWRYRDYVIKAFNGDKPYDQFLKEQIAGDLLKYRDKEDQAEKIIATGFLAIGPKGHNNRDRRQFAMDLVDEQIDAVSQSMLGLTVACARCHDHKFDPITQKDYYAMTGIFLSSETLYGTYSALQNSNPSSLIEISRSGGQPAALAKITTQEYLQLKQKLEGAEKNAQEIQAQVIAMRRSGGENNNLASFLKARNAREAVETVRADFDLFYDDGNPRTLAMGVLERERPFNSPVLVRGEISQPGEIVNRGLIEVLCAKGEPLDIAEGSGRRDLAYFIASKENPLTARVMANRVWLHLMGHGLVATPDNFGLMGQKPTHPELLDYLAVRFMENGWSFKKLIREIMLSRVYQISASFDQQNYAIDPDNKLYWRMNQRRLDAEAIRDAMLAVSGLLDLKPVAGSPVARAGEGRQGFLNLIREVTAKPFTYRSVYLPILRDQIPDFLSVFDFPDASLVNGSRDTTNVPSQSLFLMNSAEVQGASDAFALRVAQYKGTNMERLVYAYQLAFSRAPTQAELSAISGFWMRFSKVNASEKGAAGAIKEARDKAQLIALSAFCQSLFASAEFRYLN